MSKEERRQRARERANERANKVQRDEEIEGKREKAYKTCPDPEDVNGPPWNKAVLYYLETIDRRLERIEEELNIE